MENIVIIGSGGHAKSVIDAVETQRKHHIVGLIDTSRREVMGYRVLGDEAALPILVREYRIDGALIAIGDNSARAQVAKRIMALCPGLRFPAAIHPATSIGRGTTIGEGSVVMAGVVINACSTVGRHCIINTGACVDHDCEVGDYASLAPGVVTGGECKIGVFSAIGLGANLIHGITVGDDVVIGAGSLVARDIEPLTVAYGLPSKVIRTRQHGERYL
ncbi:acetyltransferase [Cupriavidus pinatubonensis]|uniref:acetyltransferase n=1 Tax=Cupriavidus pinatubonensis TaxID=248026 RepID=UPI0011273F6B|nr:acetyltransferase [Cupriavidus pinatubonensis]QYY30516.1 acetyltransferase [Cupriavidus pinatubonensis]TPQ35721.1 transferase [Cupriavidus pinatubonensis]